METLKLDKYVHVVFEPSIISRQMGLRSDLLSSQSSNKVFFGFHHLSPKMSKEDPKR